MPVEPLPLEECYGLHCTDPIPARWWGVLAASIRREVSAGKEHPDDAYIAWEWDDLVDGEITHPAQVEAGEAAALARLLAGEPVPVVTSDADSEAKGWWGAYSRGLVSLYVRPDCMGRLPLHVVLHECAHLLCDVADPEADVLHGPAFAALVAALHVRYAGMDADHAWAVSGYAPCLDRDALAEYIRLATQG